jgi:hypothetical protein
VRAKIATPKAPPRERHRSSRATSNAQKRPLAPIARQAPTNTAPAPGADGAKELAEIAAVLARSQRDIQAAIRSKDTSRMKMAMTAIARAERRGGELLIELKGKSLPISLADRKRWREAAARSPKAFEVKLRRDIVEAQARINGAGVAVDKAKPPSRPPAPAHSPAKSSSREPHTKLSSWHQEPDGSLSRQLTSGAADQAAVGAPAGSA